MKCISLWNPWAIAWLLPIKLHETRSWNTDHRGTLLIHASLKKDREVLEAIYDPDKISDLIKYGIHGARDLSYGAIIGRVDLVDCVRMGDMQLQPTVSERRWGIWTPERFAWKRGPNPVIFPRPVPYRAYQKIFNVPDQFAHDNGLARPVLSPAISKYERLFL